MKTCPLIEDSKAMITAEKSSAQVILGGDRELIFRNQIPQILLIIGV
jgi:hypothetical protein